MLEPPPPPPPPISKPSSYLCHCHIDSKFFFFSMQISDFGLSRDLQKENFYISHGGKVPVKWTAPEALHYHKYSAASDVWSYGCVLYEIWSLGHKPFQELSNSEVRCSRAAANRYPLASCHYIVWHLTQRSLQIFAWCSQTFRVQASGVSSGHLSSEANCVMS